jgi:transposase
MQPPQDVDAFVDAVLEAEGLNPSVNDRRNRLELCELVEEWLFDEGLVEGNEIRAALVDVGLNLGKGRCQPCRPQSDRAASQGRPACGPS